MFGVELQRSVFDPVRFFQVLELLFQLHDLLGRSFLFAFKISARAETQPGQQFSDASVTQADDPFTSSLPCDDQEVSAEAQQRRLPLDGASGAQQVLPAHRVVP